MSSITPLLRFLAILAVTTNCVSSAAPFCDGDGWIPFKDEKCFKLIDTFTNWGNARNICAAEILDGEVEAPTLASIRSKPEQDLLTHYIFNTSEVTVSLWLGGSKSGSPVFLWEDGEGVTFTNWAEGFPSDGIGRDCLEMVSSLSRVDEDGQWKDANCASGKLVLCEKMQTWSLADMQRKIIHASRNTVPVGFIYAQLPFTSSPEDIWPTMQWTDVSDQYAGRFFRVIGGNAGDFEDPQSDAFQGHEHTQSIRFFPSGVSIAAGNGMAHDYDRQSTSGIVAMTGYGSPRYATETRPINYSIKIWQRFA